MNSNNAISRQRLLGNGLPSLVGELGRGVYHLTDVLDQQRALASNPLLCPHRATHATYNRLDLTHHPFVPTAGHKRPVEERGKDVLF